MRPVNVVVSCSNKKKAATPDALQLQSVPEGSIGERLAEWLRRLQTENAPAHTASRLYGGDHWQAAQGIVSDGMATGIEVRLWVSSAGYGLIRQSDQLKPYSATFAPGKPDSIARSGANGSALREWWSGLAKARPARGTPRTVEELAAKDREVPLVVIASVPYVRAMEDDLTGAAGVLASPGLLSLLCIGADGSKLQGLERHLLPASARFEARVGGTRAALNSRVGRLLFQHLDASSQFTSSSLSTILETLAKDLPELKRHDRTQLSDAEVRDFISREMTASPNASKTRLLRELRASGYACEQARFSAIFAQTIGA